MKRLAAAILVAVMLCAPFGAGAIANPWKETTAEEMVQSLGISFFVPEGAENVVYRMYAEESVAEVQFAFSGAECTARIMPSVEFTDISGMYYQWESAEPCEIQWCSGEVRKVEADGQTIGLCLWYDVVPGLMYSVAMVMPEGGEADVLALANAMFVPAQGDADAAPADELVGALSACTGYMGTAGSSLKECIAAAGLLAFAVDYSGMENMGEVVSAAMAALSEEQRQELDFSLGSISGLIGYAFEDYAALSGLFDDAGVGETMQMLIENPDAQACWEAFSALL